MAQLNESVLKVIAYFDMFNYPITREEIRHFLDQPTEESNLGPVIQSMVDKQMIWQSGHFYSLRNDQHLTERRLKGNELAVKHLKRAMRISRMLSLCPYIRGIAISGSLSKNFAYKGSDFDFFIITAANRLWIARTFQFFFIKCFSWLGLRRLCCLNYYIDEQALEIGERNIFTAIEVATLLPARGKRAFQHFFSSNAWVYGFMPNVSFKKVPLKEISSWPLKSLMEWMLNNRLGDRIDNALMKYFSRRWAALMVTKKTLPNGFQLGAVVVDKHLCKPMPQHFQQNILNRFQQKLAEVKHRHTVIPD